MWWQSIIPILCIVILLRICYEDIKERAVYWFWFPVLGILLGYEHYTNTQFGYFIFSISMNIILILTILSVLYIYAKWKMKKSFLEEAFGIGDMFLFFALGVGFPMMTFVISFVCALIFALIISVTLRLKKQKMTVPLAGYMSLFFAVIFIVDKCYKPVNLYLI